MSTSLQIRRIKELSDPLVPEPTDMQPDLRKIHSIGCVVFDFYGTMFISGSGDLKIEFDPRPEHVRLFVQALRDAGYSAHKDAVAPALENFNRIIQAKTKAAQAHGTVYPEFDIRRIWEQVLVRLETEGWITGNVTFSGAQRFALEFECRFNPACPMPDLEEVLARLSTRNIPLGVLSNSQFYTPLIFEALTGMKLQTAGFDADLLCWSYQVGEKKPGHSLFRQLLQTIREKYSLPPERVLYVGNDAGNDVLPGKECGMRTALFAGDKRSLKMDAEKGHDPAGNPDLVLTRLDQLPQCIQEIS